MLKRRSKTIAILTAFIFCLTFLGAAFIAPPVAEAAFTAAVAQSNNVQVTGSRPGVGNQDLGCLKVEINTFDWTGTTGSQLLISYPTRLATATGAANTAFGATAAYVPAQAAPAAVVNNGIQVVVPGTPTTNALIPGDLAVTASASGAVFVTLNNVTFVGVEKGYFYVYFDNINTSNYSGDVNVMCVPQSGTAFGTTPVPLVVGKVNVSGSTTTTAKSVEKITSGGGGLGAIGMIDTITIFENMRQSIGENLATASTVNLTLATSGYTWAAGGGAQGLFSFAGGNMTFGGGGALAVNTDRDVATLTIATKNAAASATTGAIAVGGMQIAVDEKVAKVGQDIEVKVSGAGITEQTIVVAQYVDFVANVIEDTTTELTAGLNDQKIGTFFIEEVAPGTLVESRTILFELPVGTRWANADGSVLSNTNYQIVNNSSMNLNTNVRALDERTLKFTVANNGSSINAQNGAKIKFKDLKIDVSPSFRGDVLVTVTGKAGVEGTAKVATVSPMITMTASTPEVNLGIKEQKVSDVEVTETKADTILADNNRQMIFYLDAGFRFAKIPTVEVIEGDMVLEVGGVKIQSPANGQNLLLVPVRAASYKTPAKIKISDIYVTADRNAPVGDVILYASDTSGAGVLTSWNNTSAPAALPFAGDTSLTNNFRFDVPASVAIAKNVTVPPVETKGTTGGGSGTFVIGSNIYTVNGLTRIMDVAPYINNGRTFVPYRYLALALGVAEDDIVWDDSTKKVTVTKGENVVEATIGSTTLTVNGESVTMDVAPEIKNGRTMLPARYLAEALGGSVGWDQASKTVVFEM